MDNLAFLDHLVFQGSTIDSKRELCQPEVVGYLDDSKPKVILTCVDRVMWAKRTALARVCINTDLLPFAYTRETLASSKQSLGVSMQRRCLEVKRIQGQRSDNKELQHVQ